MQDSAPITYNPHSVPELKVYILGAGCSKHCGYPLGPQMKEDLETFGRSLDSATSPRLQKAVAETVALMGGCGYYRYVGSTALRRAT